LNPESEEIAEVQAVAPRGHGVPVVKLALFFYGALLVVALGWSAWSGRSVF
jgi:hypothetical protein